MLKEKPINEAVDNRMKKGKVAKSISSNSDISQDELNEIAAVLKQSDIAKTSDAVARKRKIRQRFLALNRMNPLGPPVPGAKGTKVS